MGGYKTCKFCTKNIGKNKLKLHCGVCQSYFHIECCEISELEARLMMAEKRSWTCKGCETSTSSRRSAVFSRTSTAGACSPADDLELKTLIKTLQEEVRELRKSVDFLSEKYEEERRRNMVITDMLEAFSKENKSLKQDVERLKSILNVQQNNQIKNNVRVNGLDCAVGDDAGNFNKIKKVLNYIDVNLSREEVADIKCFKRNHNSNVVISLGSIEKKREILKARAKKGKITVRNCGLGDSDSQVFIDEELTRDSYLLFKKARNLKTVGYKYVWHRDGKVLTRKNDGDPVVVIKNETILNEILSN